MELHPEMFKAIDSISPHGKQKDEFIASSGKGIPVWIYPAAAMFLIIILELNSLSL
jgi:hypothetical protein